jgi:hypothetical protein
MVPTEIHILTYYQTYIAKTISYIQKQFGTIPDYYAQKLNFSKITVIGPLTP